MPKPNHFDRDGLPLNGADWDGAVVLRGRAMSDGAGVVENPRKGRPLRIVGQLAGNSEIDRRATRPGAKDIVFNTDAAPGSDFAVLARWD